MKTPTIELNTGAAMPVLGLGTWRSREGQAAAAVEYALTEAGYDHIDGAAVYRNEKEIGEAYEKVFAGARARDDVFITSKLWNTEHRAEDVANACKATLHDLRLDHLDLYLMHWAVPLAPKKSAKEYVDRFDEPLDEDGVLVTERVPIRETWEAMEELVKAGLVKAIGVSNFTTAHLLDLLSHAKVVPAMNQVELHPYNQQNRLIEFCGRKGIVTTGYSPLGTPGNFAEGERPAVLHDGAIAAIAKAHDTSPAQVLIRWAVQRGTVSIPKSTHPERIKANREVFGFELTDEEMKTIASLDRGYRYVDPYEWWKIPYFD